MAIACSGDNLYDQMVVSGGMLTANTLDLFNNLTFSVLDKKIQESSTPKALEPIDPKLQQLWENRRTPLGEIELRYELMAVPLPMYHAVGKL